jgi:hypothetical protein
MNIPSMRERPTKVEAVEMRMSKKNPTQNKTMYGKPPL